MTGAKVGDSGDGGKGRGGDGQQEVTLVTANAVAATARERRSKAMATERREAHDYSRASLFEAWGNVPFFFSNDKFETSFVGVYPSTLELLTGISATGRNRFESLWEVTRFSPSL
jgi:hypothetical protein